MYYLSPSGRPLAMPLPSPWPSPFGRPFGRPFGIPFGSPRGWQFVVARLAISVLALVLVDLVVEIEVAH